MRLMRQVGLALAAVGVVVEALARFVMTVLGLLMAIPIGVLLPFIIMYLQYFFLILLLSIPMVVWGFLLTYPLHILGGVAACAAIVLLGRRARRVRREARSSGFREVPLELVKDQPDGAHALSRLDDENQSQSMR